LDATANYPAFKINFQENGIYSSANGGQVFRPTGTWSWIDKITLVDLQLDVFTDVTIISFSSERMTWIFNYSFGGVSAGTTGNYKVMLEKL